MKKKFSTTIIVIGKNSTGLLIEQDGDREIAAIVYELPSRIIMIENQWAVGFPSDPNITMWADKIQKLD